jgi:hypothetical protein
MMNLISNALATPVASTNVSYASVKNARFNNTASNVLTIKQRWDETFNSLPVLEQRAITAGLQAAVNEFQRRNPTVKSWRHLRKELARAIDVKMSNIKIDGTMQRLLNINWVLHLLNIFVATKVIPIQVYQPDPTKDEYLAWDGQHTLVLLWLIATQIFAENPETLEVPVNIYASHLKPEMRQSFVDLNGPAGKRGLDQFDHYEQMVYGVRIDGSTNPLWVITEQKQTAIESRGLFLTSKKFGDHDQPGAISRSQEITKVSPEVVGWICDYLVAVGAQGRPVEEKEMVMMSYFFESCRHADIKVTAKYIKDVANVTKARFAADFSPTSIFWTKANNAYKNWHATHIVYGTPRFNKEPVHGYPFLVKQLEKDVPGMKLPKARSSSEFQPSAEDLF